MRKITKIGIGIAVTIGVVAGLWVYHAHKLYEESYTSEYHYEITLETDSTLYNVTFYLPLPVFEQESKIGYEIVGGNASKPDDWDCHIIETEHGKMLKISADKIAPEFHSLPVPIEPGEEPKEPPQGKVSDTFSEETPVLMPEELSVGVHAEHDINTKNPVGNEPLLSPKYNLTRSTCEFPYPAGGTPDCYEYESRIYAHYTTSLNAKLSLYIELEGRNSWWVYGWSGNEYRDNVHIALLGESHGWNAAVGQLVEGEGRYGWL